MTDTIKPVAWLKTWSSVGGAVVGRRLVELRPECDLWLANMFPKIDPLYAASDVAAPARQMHRAMIDVHGDFHLMPDRPGPAEAFANLKAAIAAASAFLAQQEAPKA